MAIEQRVLVDALSARLCLSGGEYKLLQFLANAADKNGNQIYKGVAAMCAATRLKKRHVYNLLAKFEDRGWIRKVRQGGGRGIRTIYSLTLSPSLRAANKPVEIAAPFPVEIAAPFPSQNGAFPRQNGAFPRQISLVTRTVEATSAPDPSNVDPSNVPRTTGADAPALSRLVDEDDTDATTIATESETGNRIPAALFDRAVHPHAPPGDRQHRPKGDDQGASHVVGLPATGLVDGLPGGGRGGARVPDVAPGTADRDAAVAAAGGATGSDAGAATLDDGPGQVADDDARRRDTFAHIDIRDYLRQLKARLNIGVRKATTKVRKP